MKKLILSAIFLMAFFSCKKETKASVIESAVDSLEVSRQRLDSLNKTIKMSNKELKAELNAKGFQTFDYIDKKTQDTILMQQYFMVFLKSGPIRSQNEEETQIQQEEHREYLAKMYELGYAGISGPFIDNGAINEITIYNVPTLKMADSLAKLDPMVKDGRLIVEIHPWWAAKGYSVR